MINHSKPWITKDDFLSVNKALQKKLVGKGLYVKIFEKNLKEFLKANYIISLSSGTSALILALKCLKLKEDDEVILPTFVCKSVYEAVLTVGAKPVLCDVNDLGLITNDTVKQMLTSKTKVIIAVHIFGNTCDIKSLMKFKIPIIEDACHSFGNKIDTKYSGTIADFGFFSLNGTKLFSTGEGGIFVAKKKKYFNVAKRLVSGCLTKDSMHMFPLSDLGAALGISQLKKYHKFVKKRSKIMNIYSQKCKKLGLDFLIDKNTKMLFRFVIKSEKNFNELQKKFSLKGIIIKKGLDMLLHRYIKINNNEFKNANKLFRKIVSVPFYPALKNKEIDKVQKNLNIL